MSPGRNIERVSWGEGLQVVTNHLLMRYPSVDDLPLAMAAGGRSAGSERLREVSDLRRYTPDEIVASHATIRFVNRDIPVRTLWHVLYKPAAVAMTVSFYVRDSMSVGGPKPSNAVFVGTQMPAQIGINADQGAVDQLGIRPFAEAT